MVVVHPHHVPGLVVLHDLLGELLVGRAVGAPLVLVRVRVRVRDRVRVRVRVKVRDTDPNLTLSLAPATLM